MQQSRETPIIWILNHYLGFQRAKTIWSSISNSNSVAISAATVGANNYLSSIFKTSLEIMTIVLHWPSCRCCCHNHLLLLLGLMNPLLDIYNWNTHLLNIRREINDSKYACMTTHNNIPLPQSHPNTLFRNKWNI